jgi:hypothetical protein
MRLKGCIFHSLYGKGESRPRGTFEINGSEKTPFVPFGGGLRFNFLVGGRLERALDSSVFARLTGGAFYKTRGLMIFYEIFKYLNSQEDIQFFLENCRIIIERTLGEKPFSENLINPG